MVGSHSAIFIQKHLVRMVSDNCYPNIAIREPVLQEKLLVLVYPVDFRQWFSALWFGADALEIRQSGQ